MSKIKWEKANLCGTEPGIAKDDSVFEYWHTEYGGIFCEILPTNIIHGNKDFGKEECSWTVNIMNLSVTTRACNNIEFRLGVSFGIYKSVLAAKRDANKCILELVEKGR